MPEITLREYEYEIDRLIEDARYLEALAHIRHLLGQFPRFAGGYYLLGKALLEADQPTLAIDMFRRALNGDPDHLMARIGLGLAHERCEDIDAAIWNLERALELNPGDKELADELRRLYGRRDGLEPSHIPLSRSGLARLYIRGHHYHRAVEELRGLLAENPDRLDLRATLAEAYWRGDQTVQAADTCQQVLDQLRYCLKANLLLGALWVNSGQEEGQPYLRRAQEVDPENRTAAELLGPESPLEPQEVPVDRLVYEPNAIDVDQEADWFRQLKAASVTVGISEAIPEIGESETRLVDITADLESQIELPDWLRELSGSSTEASSLTWMADVGIGEETLEAGEPETTTADLLTSAALEEDQGSAQEIADWLTMPGEPVGATEGAPGEMPMEEAPEIGAEWLSALGEGATPSIEEAEPQPDWLSELASTPAETAPTEAEIPDWLSALAPGAAITQEMTPASSETPDWLGELQSPMAVEEAPEEAPAASGQIQEETQLEMPEQEPEQGIPDWLSNLAPAAAAEIGGEPASVDDVPVWLREFQPEESTEPDATPPAEPEAIPDWLRAFEPTEVAAETALVQPAEWEPLEIEAETPSGEAEELSAAEEGIVEALEQEAPAPDEASAREEKAPQPGFFGWEAFGEEASQLAAAVEETSGVAEPGPHEAEAALESLVQEQEALVAPVAEGDLVSGDEALAWLESLTLGKEEELRAQAEAESEARVAEILGRKPQVTEPEPPTLIEPTPTVTEAVVEPDLGFAAAPLEPQPEPAAPLIEETATPEVTEQAEALLEEAPVAPAAEGDLLSGEDALAWLESLTLGKEEELRAQAEAESEARVAEILGRKPQVTEPEPPTLIEPIPTVTGGVVEPDLGFAAAPFEPQPEPAAPLIEETAAPEVTEQAEALLEEAPVAPAAEGDLLSGEDALAWLESLTLGKEEELRAQAEAESEARVAEILGRKPQVTEPEPATLIEPTPAIAEAVVEPDLGFAAAPLEPQPEPAAPLIEEAPTSEVTEQAVEAAEATVKEPMFGWSTLGEPTRAQPLNEMAPEEQPVVPSFGFTQFIPETPQPASEELPTPEPVVVAEAPALEELPAAEPAAAVEIPLPEELPAPEPVVVAEAPALEELPVAEPAVVVETPLPEELPAPEPAVVAEAPALEEPPAAEPAVVVEIPLPEELPTPEPVVVAEAPALEEPPAAEPAVAVAVSLPKKLPAPEPAVVAEAPTLEEPAAQAPAAAAPMTPDAVPAAEQEDLLAEPDVRAAAQVSEATAADLDELRAYVKANRSDHTARLELARALWKAGEARESLESYNRLIRSKTKIDEVLNDLETYSEDRPRDTMLLRALGDAHMRNGDLQKALELFNRAMDML